MDEYTVPVKVKIKAAENKSNFQEKCERKYNRKRK